ncbi:hypothetical protein ElyMa_002571600 [Elysia marginata]|uniref:Uncharacterized protein n=1 Tax=Elysia marginata TaxID=1093978 RepID=A0AAV4H089_9GAST|nr:hypothetical protein ElyMa_002571600 [Elysia marginata]
MLPFLAASGQKLYAKSVHIYLQHMQVLPLDHPEVYERFCRGQHVIRRSDRFWARLFPNLVIEQVLMRSVKNEGGLTSGRGFEVSSPTQWLLSMPACSEINSAMQELTDAQYGNSEQHKESTDYTIVPRQQRY